MDQLTQHIELFEAYQAKLLDESAILEFEARLNSDSEFRKAYQDFLSIEEGLKRHYKSEFFNQLQDLDQELDKELGQNKKYSVKKIIVYTTTIAASFLIFFFGYSYFQSQDHIELAKEYWPIEPGLPVKMSTKGKYDEAMNAYKLGEFDKANTLLDKISSDTSIYFQGVIAYELNDFRASRGFFNQIEKGSLYFNNAQFRLGLILLSEGDLISAKRIFNTQTIENNLFAKESKEILKKI
jgi:hypothetical protein